MQDGKIVALGQSDASGAQCFALARYTADGRLDTTFNGTGVVTTSFGRMWQRGEGVAIQQGKILAIGNVSDGSGGSDLALARYNLNGALDTTFGAGTGKVITNFDTGDNIYQVAVYPTGSEYANYIVVVGEIYGPNHGGYSNLLVARYKPDGSLDTTFGDGGLVVDRHDNVGYDVALQPDGKIVVAGVQVLWEPAFHVDFFAARYDTSGNLDPTFGSVGSVATQIPNLAASAQSVLIQPDGKIVLTGYGYDAAQRYYIALARYDTYGTLDASFGASGAAGASAASPAALTDAALADAGRQQLALAALLQYEDQLQAKPAARSKGLELPAVDLALADLAG